MPDRRTPAPLRGRRSRRSFREDAWNYDRTVPIRTVLNSRVPIKVWTGVVEDSARKQLVNTGALPFVFRHVAAMADTHWGMGATVGSVIATRGAICPAAVGVDIGCGMAAVKTSLDASALDGKLPELRHSIERSIPVGFHQRKEPHARTKEFLAKAEGGPSVASEGEIKKAAHQCGTLGGGNHFIEICVDQDDSKVWVLLHSGSRNIGKVTAEKHIGKAKKILKNLDVELPDPDLAYFTEGTSAFDAYVEDLKWCQESAFVNRQIMLEDVFRSDDSKVWVLLHSGSRNIGKVTAEKHIGKAKKILKNLDVELPDPDLAYFTEGTSAFDAYVEDLKWCQESAFVNRQIMLEDVL